MNVVVGSYLPAYNFDIDSLTAQTGTTNGRPADSSEMAGLRTLR